MSKTAAEWWERTPGPLNWPEPAATQWLQAIIDDARAGMVPEGECKHSPCLECAFQKVTAERDKAEAELAKAWEAGASAALAECPHGQPNCSTCRDRIRALEPPGGKAK